jgi:hypothetical protein
MSEGFRVVAAVFVGFGVAGCSAPSADNHAPEAPPVTSAVITSTPAPANPAIDTLYLLKLRDENALASVPDADKILLAHQICDYLNLPGKHLADGFGELDRTHPDLSDSESGFVLGTAVMSY